MPHILLEYSDNLDFEIQPLLADLHQALVSTGAVQMRGLKSRAVKRTEYRVADGNPDYAFVHISLLIKEGRPQEVKEELARQVMKVLKSHLGDRFETGYLALSMDTKEMHQGTELSEHNIPDS